MIALRLDHSWSDTQKTFANIRWANSSLGGNDFFLNRATGNNEIRTPKGFGVDHVWTVSPSKVLDLRFNVSRMEDSLVPQNDGFDSTQLGFPASFAAKRARSSSTSTLTRSRPVTRSSPASSGTGALRSRSVSTDART